MTPDEWRTIVAEYGIVLKEESRKASFIPESKLPHSREAIKQAIVQGLKEIDIKNESLRENLEVAYICLANFIPDEEAELTAKSETLLRQLSTLATMPLEQQERLKEELAKNQGVINRLKETFERTKKLSDEYRKELDALKE